MTDLKMPPAGKGVVAREVVARLADFAGEVDGLKGAFTDPIDLAALRQAVTLIHDVAIAHDEAGDYGVYARDDEPDGAGDPDDAGREGLEGADDAGWNWHVDLEVAEFEADEDYASTHGIAPGPYVRLTVSDTGAGMPADVAEPAGHLPSLVHRVHPVPGPGIRASSPTRPG